jgi:pimeloyl-ACP methyl ester carboxylesterase
VCARNTRGVTTAPTEDRNTGGTEPKVLLIHGAATTSRVWRRVLPHLAGFHLDVPDRPASGDLDTELAALAPLSPGRLVVGVSGGATLGLALLTAGVAMTGAVLHEPAAGSLAPGLLDAVAAAWAGDGVQGFATTLYGPAWQPEEAPADPDAVGRDLGMFRAFEPAPLPADHPPVLLTVGEMSPPARHASVAALARFLRVPIAVVPGARHAVHLEHPVEFAALIRQVPPNAVSL